MMNQNQYSYSYPTWPSHYPLHPNDTSTPNQDYYYQHHQHVDELPLSEKPDVHETKYKWMEVKRTPANASSMNFQ